ncbi:hypothetical protein G7Z17_g463 [Cylindrodendrum hubeiense]|uniref:Uncharacterized protein n=1 Tax=Cylindrodendrum hubeiense TaxID=595255 RepID=A0A9P5HGY5_9HYPO|nr:hypothetical protein G7Z17_g463 [Cylindrodendrum hubeiense]
MLSSAPLASHTPRLLDRAAPRLVKCHFQSADGDGAEGSLNHAGIETGLHDAREYEQVSAQMAEIFATSLALRHKTCSFVSLLEYNGSALEKASPVRCLCQRKLSKVTPQTWSQDPYLVCILLSMAQSLARKSHSAQPGVYVVPSSVWRLLNSALLNSAHLSKTRLLVTTKSDSAFVHLFEAEITSELLDILDDPALSMTHVSWPIIRHSKLPFQPYSTLQGRLMARLVGAQESLRMEPTNFDGTKVISNKRKLAEENDFARRVRLKG